MTSAVEGQIEFEHLHRYCVARELCVACDVLDVASGEGYGAALLANVAKSVTGVEIDPAAVAHAAANYRANNLRFLRGDALALPLPDASIDVVVCFETIEHLIDPERFMSEVRRVLRSGGCFVVSTPDRAVYSAPGSQPNPYHILEMTEPEFRLFLQARFANVRILAQRPVLGSLLAEGSLTWRSYERRGSEIIEATNGLARAHYVLGIATDGILPELPSSVYLDSRSVHSVVDDSRRLPLVDAHAAQMTRERDAALGEVARAAAHHQQQAARVAEAESALKEAQQELARNEGALAQLRSDAAEATRAAAHHAAELEHRRATVQEQAARVAEAEFALKKARHELAANAGALAQLRADVEVRTRALEEAQRKLAANAGALAQLRADAEVRARALEEAQRKLAANAGALAQLRADAEIRTRALEEAQRKLAANAGALAQLRADAEVRARALEEAKRALGEREQQFGSLKRELDLARHNIAALDRRIRGMEISTIWRMSKPIRRVGTRFPKTKRGVRKILKAAWLTVSGRLPSHLAARRRFRSTVNLIRQSGLFDPRYYAAMHADVTGSQFDPVIHYVIAGATEGRDPHPLFDSDWYLQCNPDVAAAGVNPLVHYLLHGAAQGRDPHPLFNSDWYLQCNPDLAAAGVNPLVHYLLHGATGGRDPHPLFDSDWYLQCNPDVAAAGVNSLVHYLLHGATEGRDPHPLFDSDWYLQCNPDVAAAGVNPLVHYLLRGATEGRDPHPLFDSDWYLQCNPDVAAAGVNPLVHYLLHGATEGRDPHPLFDSDWYLQCNPDVAAAGVNPLVDCLLHGAPGGRDPHPLFDSDWYLQCNPDVAAAGVNPLVHYLLHGAAEGRDPHPLFDSDWYLQCNPDVAAAGVNPLVHYLLHGATGGRDPHPLFDSDWYLQCNPDVAAAGVNPLVHYLLHGATGGRDPHPLFDSDWYLQCNPDVAAAGVNPLVHYLLHGATGGRDPHPLFDSDWYLQCDPDVAAAGVNPLVHYLLHGATEGRDPHPLFDSDWYLQCNPDVAAAGVNPLVDYLLHGATGGRDPHPLFDSDWYLQCNPDVAAAGGNPLVHYLLHGATGGHDPHPLFDSDWYLQCNPDVAAAGVNPLVHYLLHGATEGRDPHPLFDSDWYLQCNPDVAAAGVNPLVHYLLRGATEGRDPHPLFDSDWYLQCNSDVAAAGVNPLVHYLLHGATGGRDPHPLFDGRYYGEAYPRDAADTDAPLLYYVKSGAAIGQNPNAAFDAKGYAYEHEDVTRFAGNALIHYVRVGRAAGFHPHPLFERDWYLANNPEISQSGLDPYEHYVRHGLCKGRLGSRALGSNPNIRGPFALPKSASEPEVTVIIPSYKSYFDTYRCLVSISRLAGNQVDYAVILADDCPDKPVGPLLTDHPDVKVIANERNLGFLRNCNHAAEVTESKFIVFLNNDTVVKKDWLAPMLALANRDTRVGMIGCKLLNSDDTLQEAGGIILRDGWGSPFGRGDDPTLPEYNYVREVDCVIGACMLVRRSAFAALGGFDAHFAPAFYEEFDFAFALQEKNYRVLYQPASEIYHFGSASYGAETRDRQSRNNHAKFCEKWVTRLLNQPESEAGTFYARERPKRSGTILVIDDAVPEYDKHAGGLTTFQYVQLLVEHDFKVIFLPHNRLARQPYAHTLQQMGVEVLFGDFDLAKWLDDFGQFIDHIWVSRPNVAKDYLNLLRSRTQAHITYYTHDLHFLREMRRYEIEDDQQALAECRRLKPIETEIFNSVDCVTTPSEDEARIIEELAPGQVVRVLIPFFFKQNNACVSTRAEKLDRRREIIFVGGYNHRPNVDAAIMLVNSVMPLVWREIPDARVLILGSNPPDAVVSLKSAQVDVIGYVPDLVPYYERARMSVSPLRYGAGVKGKIISSLQAGVPVVTTKIGNEGIALRPGIEVLVGGTPEELAAHVVRLFRDSDLLNAMAAAGKRLVSERFSEEKARDVFFEAIELQFCNVCGDRRRLTRKMDVKPTDNWPEEFHCERCHSLNRTRALADVLIKPYRQFHGSSVREAAPYLADLRIHAFGRAGAIHRILQASKNFSCSDFFGHVPVGEHAPNGILCQDLQRLTFRNEELDICISEDVFERVPDPTRGFSEIYRTLKPGGCNLFAVPFNPELTASATRGPYLKNDANEDVLPPEGCGDPSRLKDATYTDFGQDLIQILESIGFVVNLHEVRCGGFGRRYISVFETRKPS